MNPDQNDAVLAPTDPPAIPAASSVTTEQPDYKAKFEEWQRRAAGFQSAFQKEQAEKLAAVKRAEEAELKLSSTLLQVGEVEKERNGLKELYEQVNTELGVTKTGLLLKDAVISDQKYSPLIPFLRDGLLPTAPTVEELLPALDKFLANVGLVVNSQAQTVATQRIEEQKGAMPPTPSGTSTMDKSTLQKEAFAALRAGDQARYEELIAKANKLP